MELVRDKENEIKEIFGLDSLRDHQLEGLQAICASKDVFVGTKTGSGKSLIYECKSTYIGKDLAEDYYIISGDFQFVFGSPETLVGDRKWRNMLTNYGGRMKLLVVDEAHTVVQWGHSEEGKDSAFREWFSHIGELRAIRPDVPIAALTATSSPSQRRKIMKSLCFRQSAVLITESPDRKNIKMSTLCIPNNRDVEETFSWLLEELETHKENLSRHIIFAESISDVSKVFTVFRRRFGNSELFEMFHSKTVESKKDFIRADMAKEGKIRVLICTNSAGMGVNFFNVHNIIHFGLPREMDTFVQQMGRAGRDGKFSHELIIYKCHKGHLKRTEEELVRLAKDTKCRREILCSSYGSKLEKINPLHLCCDICEQLCKCEESECPRSHPALQFTLLDCTVNTMSREVEESDRILLRQKLDSLRFQLSDFSIIVNPDLTHGLSDDVIDYIVNHTEFLFTPEDILKSCAVWSYNVSAQISTIINDIFGDDLMYEVVDSEEDDYD